MPDGWTNTESPFHTGEQDAQERMGVRDIEDWARKVVRPYLPAQHRDFHTSLPFLVAAALDKQKRPWVSLLTGPEGFITSPDPESLILEIDSLKGDPLEGALNSGAYVGLLGIELSNRRRNRVNGRVEEDNTGRLVFRVDQSFGNCPQYIHERKWTRVDEILDGINEKYKELTPKQQQWISQADTFFVASGYVGEDNSTTNGMDASHRGGEPGFVQIVSDTRIMFPDYAGNNHFNTVGNLLENPKAGFLFVDFVSGSLLHLTGTTFIDWNSESVAKIPGARRLITFDIEDIVERRNAVPLRWDETADYVRSIRLIEKVKESKEISSFVFQSRDGAPLPMFEAGQYLPIELDLPEVGGSVGRTYSLSGPPNTENYRISVKRESHGVASRYLHDQLEIGAIIESRQPTGGLILPCVQCPVVLISAGVGLTPMVSMLHSLADATGKRPVWFIHGARNGAYHAMAAEVKSLSNRQSGIRTHIAYSHPRDEDELGRDYDSEGRVTGELINNLVNIPGAQYLLCGPTRFMADIQTVLEENGISSEKIHTESFGPTG